jgi:predicted  nucleic acid-binding Zn-ribbon protein
MNEKELLELKQQLKDSEAEISKIDARKEVLLEQLKEKFGVATVKLAKKMLDQLQKEIEDITQELAEIIEELEKEMELNEGEDYSTSK